MKVTLLVLVALSSSIAAPKKFEAKSKSRNIKYWHEVTPHSIPSQAFLEVYSEDEGWYCGGSLISQNYVLTSAGCCRGKPLEFHVRLGVHKLFEDEDTQILVVSNECTVHEDYNAIKDINDVAVIKLPEPVMLTSAIQPIALPSRADVNNTYAFYAPKIIGWAITYNFGEWKFSDVLNFIDARVLTNEDCAQDLPFAVDESVLCTDRSHYSGSCSGNAGSPLIDDDQGAGVAVQIGIVSYGIAYCLPNYPSKYARITSFLDWLESHTDVVIS